MPAVSRPHFPCSQPWPNTEQNREGIFIFFCFVALPLTPRKRNRNCCLCVRVLGHTHGLPFSTFSGLWQKPVGMFTPNHWSRRCLCGAAIVPIVRKRQAFTSNPAFTTLFRSEFLGQFRWMCSFACGEHRHTHKRKTTGTGSKKQKSPGIVCERSAKKPPTK